MVSHVSTISFDGLNTALIDVQVHIANGIPSFNIVGLPDKSIAESKERVRSSLNSIALSLPPKRITINLSPADIRKEGSHYDLAIALGILISMDVMSQNVINNFIVMGELSLDSKLLPVLGILPAAIHANMMKKSLICPASNGSEALWANDIKVLAPDNLLQLINFFKGETNIDPPQNPSFLPHTNYPDMKDIKGQKLAKRALEIAAAGGHNMLMKGPPGTGKSMLASRLPGLLPDMTSEETLATTMISSLSTKIQDGKISKQRPFRSPHHSCSVAAMVGGGRYATPGEISLAHNGVLFLDELPEFPRNVLDSLRQPMESNTVSISRANRRITYPANFQLIAAMNSCKCGYLEDPQRSCKKAPECSREYQLKVSGPILDRIDIYITVHQISFEEMVTNNTDNESSEVIRSRVLNCRKIQSTRFQGLEFFTNAKISTSLLEKFCKLDTETNNLLSANAKKLNLSGRGYHKILRLARTIADLESEENISKNHILEALSYRSNTL